MGSESTTRSLFLSLARYLSVYVFVHTPFTFFPLFLAHARKRNEEMEKGEEKDTGGDEDGEGSRREGEVWESLHASGSTSARVITRSEGERASTVSRVHALFGARIRVLSPAGRCMYTAVRYGESTEFPRQNARARAHNASRNERVRASYFYIRRHTQQTALRKSLWATAKGDSKVDFFFFLPSEVNSRYNGDMYSI